MALTDFDTYLFGRGEYRRAYDRLGAHPCSVDGETAVHFAVWAPNAEAVSVVGDFNQWSPGQLPLAAIGDSGIWQGRVPGLSEGALYKYAIKPSGGELMLKADPYAFWSEVRPGTASRVVSLEGYEWQDSSWMEERPRRDWRASPLAVYEVHLASWRRDPAEPDRFLSYRELAEQLPEYVAGMGFSHIELLPVAEHPLDMSWGYQTTGYFAPTARFGTPSDFMYFVDSCHASGLGVILDWVPAHFPKDAHALARFDGTALYEHADPRQGEHPDWGTLIFNYGRTEVRSFLLSNALFWLDRYHIDGLRVDAVASMLYLDYSRETGEWIPNRYGGRENLEAIDLLQEVNRVAHEQFPGVLTFAEESTAWPQVTGDVGAGGLGFDFKWNMGWMHDTLAYLARDPIHRRHHHTELTFSLMYAFSERFLLPLSHDEVVHGKRSLLEKMPGDEWQRFANLRLLLSYLYAHPGKKLLFMGNEFGQRAEWKYDASLDWHETELPGETGQLHRGVQHLVRDLNGLYRDLEALHAIDSDWTGFQWIDFLDADNSVVAFRRRGHTAHPGPVVVANFTPVVRTGYRLGLPAAGAYREVFNSDSLIYGGSGISNAGQVAAEPVPWHGQPFSAALTLPPLALFLLLSG